jgi:3-oxoacyl-[acyl-carrier protein] reductase
MMDLGLAGKVALVTGSSRGIGASIALGLAAEGCDVMLTGRDEAALKEVAAGVAKLGRKACYSTLDLSQPQASAVLVAEHKKHFSKLDILINNAGATKRGDFRELTDADWKDGFELKFFAHVRLSREAWPLLVASKGSVVGIAGIGGKEPEAEFGIGSSVNAACVAWSKALADVGKKEGVQVNTVNPGRVETERLWRRIRARVSETGESEATIRAEYLKEFNITRFGLVEDITGLIAFMVSPHGRWLHGATIDMDGGEVRGL